MTHKQEKLFNKIIKDYDGYFWKLIGKSKYGRDLHHRNCLYSEFMDKTYYAIIKYDESLGIKLSTYLGSYWKIVIRDYYRSLSNTHKARSLVFSDTLVTCHDTTKAYDYSSYVSYDEDELANYTKRGE